MIILLVKTIVTYIFLKQNSHIRVTVVVVKNIQGESKVSMDIAYPVNF